jgi:hypothetical protein
MLRNKKIKTAIIALLIIAGLHFVPVYSKTGYLNQPAYSGPDGVSSNLCIGYLQPVNDAYRVITLGLKGFKDDKQILVSDNSKGACIQ